MKNYSIKCKSTTLSFLLLIGALLFITPSIALPQSIDSAREKYESGNFEAALHELQSILTEDSENLEAQSLLGKVELAMRKEQAEELKRRALVEINNRRFEEAYGYLERALIVDPENSEARELYLSIHEVLQVEGESLEEMLERQQEELTTVGEEIPSEALEKLEAVEKPRIVKEPEAVEEPEAAEEPEEAAAATEPEERPVEEEDMAKLPSEVADLLIKKGRAAPMDEPKHL